MTITDQKIKEIILKNGTTLKQAFLILEGTVRGYVTNNEGIFVAYPTSLFRNEVHKFTFETIG